MTMNFIKWPWISSNFKIILSIRFQSNEPSTTIQSCFKMKICLFLCFGQICPNMKIRLQISKCWEFFEKYQNFRIAFIDTLPTSPQFKVELKSKYVFLFYKNCRYWHFDLLWDTLRIQFRLQVYRTVWFRPLTAINLQFNQ